MAFDPTPEQQAILAEYANGSDLVIQAGAGSGKTTTLRLLAESTPERQGLYVAYNKAIQTDAAASFPSNVTCKTAHALAFGSVGLKYKHRLNGPRMTYKQQAAQMGIHGPFPITSELSLSPSQQVSVVKDTIKHFCNSDDPKLGTQHIWKVEGAEDNMGTLRSHILPIAQRVWEDAKDANGKLPFQHDYYLKMWAMTRPNLNVPVVFYDEAQDANPCIAGVVLAQRDYGSQVIMVGDSAQAIYGWNGAVDAMAKFEQIEGVKTLFLSQSFRFGHAVANEANKFLDLIGAPLRVSGFDKIDSKVGLSSETPDAILCRTNAEAISQALSYQSQGLRVAVVGGTKDIERLAKAADSLMDGKQPFDSEFAAFSNWNDFVAHVNEDGDSGLKVFVRLVTEYGVNTIMGVCRSSVNEDRADVIVSTAHKAKGREWDHVKIASDFRPPAEDEEPRKDEMMLAYVAVTRARKILNNEGLAWVNTLVGPPKDTPVDGGAFYPEEAAV